MTSYDGYENYNECPECGEPRGHGVEGCPEEWKCVLGDECLVADPYHHRSECFDAEMAKAQERKYMIHFNLAQNVSCQIEHDDVLTEEQLCALQNAVRAVYRKIVGS